MATLELLKQIEQFADKLRTYAEDVNSLCSQLEELHGMSWKDVRIAEISNMGLPCDDDHPYFDEYQAILNSDHETYDEFMEDFRNEDR